MSLGIPANLLLSPLFYLAFIPLLYLLRKPFLRLCTPQGIPGIPALPTSSPFWGDIPFIANAAKTTQGSTLLIHVVAKVVGPIVQVRISFLRTLVVVTDYQETERALTSHTEFDRALLTTSVFRHLLPTGQISMPTNQMWKHHRRIIGPAMASKHLSLTTPRANEAVKGLVDLLGEMSKKAGARGFSVGGIMESATMDAICGMAFGESWGIIQGYREQVKALGNPPAGEAGEAVFKLERPAIADATWALFEALPLQSPFPAISFFFTTLKPSHRRSSRLVQTYLQDRLVQSRKKTKLIGGDAAAELADNTLDMMVARESKAEDWMPDNEMLDEVLLYLVAGTETSGVTLTWWLKYMTNNPSIQRKLRDHILQRMPELQDRQPTFEDLNSTNLPYLEAVVHEALRLSRTAGGYVREAKQDVIVLGHRVPKGTVVLFTTATGTEDASTPTAAPHNFSTDPSAPSAPTSEKTSTSENDNGSSDTLIRQTEALDPLRADPTTKRKVGYWAAGTGREFNPDRWIDDKGEFDLHAGPSLPFSLGQRGCGGKNLALLELRLFMVQLTLAFFFGSLPDSQNSMELYETVALHPKQSFIRPLSWDSDEAKGQE